MGSAYAFKNVQLNKQQTHSLKTLFLLLPFLVIPLGFLIRHFPYQVTLPFGSSAKHATLVFLIYSIIDLGHANLTFVRSHLTQKIFKQDPTRFVFLPLLLIALMSFSKDIFLIFFFILPLWGLYHFSAQRYGIFRLFETTRASRTQNRIDLAMCFVISSSPYIVASQLKPLVKRLERLQLRDPELIIHWPTQWLAKLGTFSSVIIALSVVIFIAFLFSNFMQYRRGTLSWFKVSFLTSLLASNIICTFMFPYEGIVAQKTLHFLEYFVFFYFIEADGWKSRPGPLSSLKPGLISLMSFAVVSLGIFAVIAKGATGTTYYFYQVFFVTVVVLHYYYDGLIWPKKSFSAQN